MNILWLFDTCGYIFGPAIMATGAIAVLLCAWATYRPHSRPLSRRGLRVVLGVAFAPLAVAFCGVLFGLGVCLANNVDVAWGALGKVVLAGAVVSLVPVIWAFFLRARRTPEPQAATGA